MPEDYDPLSFDYNSLNFDYVDIYGEDGSLEKSIDVYGLIKEADLFKINPDDYKELKEEFLAQIHGDDSEADDSDEESGDEAFADEESGETEQICLMTNCSRSHTFIHTGVSRQVLR